MRLLTDIEVCIDRIADMRIQDINLVLKKQSVIEQHQTAKQTGLPPEPETPAADLLKNVPVILLDALMHKETADEKWAFTICWVFGIDYMNLSEDNRITLACVFKKSSVLPKEPCQPAGKLSTLSLFGKKKPKE